MPVLELGLFILNYVSRWKLFEKAGEAGWKALIPYYSQYIYCKACRCTKVFIFDVILSVSWTLILITTLLQYVVDIFHTLYLTGHAMDSYYVDEYMISLFDKNIGLFIGTLVLLSVISVALIGLRMFENYKFVSCFTDQSIYKILAVIGTLPPLYFILVASRSILAFDNQYHYHPLDDMYHQSMQM